jgi:hypothetical protein
MSEDQLARSLEIVLVIEPLSQNTLLFRGQDGEAAHHTRIGVEITTRRKGRQTYLR